MEDSEYLSIRNAAEKAVEYWAEQLDVDSIYYSDENVDRSIAQFVEKYKLDKPEELKGMEGYYQDLKTCFMAKVRAAEPSKEKIEVFKEKLLIEIIREVSDPTKKCCVLSTDENGAELILAIVARRCGIVAGKSSLFKKNVEVLVEAGKVELRFNPNGGISKTIYDERMKLSGVGSKTHPCTNSKYAGSKKGENYYGKS